MDSLSGSPIQRVLAELAIDAQASSVEPLGAGHIHRTYLVRGPGPSLVLQQLNTNVFPDPERLVANTGRVIEGLAEARSRGEYPLEFARPVPGRGGDALIRVDGETWRATTHIDGTYSVNRVDTAERAERSAEAFGLFCAALAAVDPAELVELLPGFHDLDTRLDQLQLATRNDENDRASEVGAEIDYCRRHTELGLALRAAMAGLPQRVCHNDTKITNLLFDLRDHRARAVIDLDTCMPGWWLHDFGDIVRTFCSPEEEDSTRLDRVGVRDDIFRAVCEGFVRPLDAHLVADERESLWLGACALPLIVGIRFLTDYLVGDRYFRVARPGQNLDRARNQLALHRDLTARENSLRPYLA